MSGPGTQPQPSSQPPKHRWTRRSRGPSHWLMREKEGASKRQGWVFGRWPGSAHLGPPRSLTSPPKRPRAAGGFREGRPGLPRTAGPEGCGASERTRGRAKLSLWLLAPWGSSFVKGQKHSMAASSEGKPLRNISASTEVEQQPQLPGQRVPAARGVCSCVSDQSIHISLC